MKKKKWHIGDFYEDCAYHPCLVTCIDGDVISGISLIDGSSPRSCSISHCGVVKLTLKQALDIKQSGPRSMPKKDKEDFEKKSPNEAWWLDANSDIARSSKKLEKDKTGLKFDYNKMRYIRID